MNGLKMQSRAAVPISVCMLLVVVVLIMALPLVAQQPAGDAALVQQFFPQSLVDEATTDFNNGGPEPFQASAFSLADLNGAGTPQFLVAAYTNGFSAVVRVLRKQGASAVLVNEPTVPLMGGIYPTVSLIDLDNDGHPEVVVGLSSARGAIADWIFKWNGSGLDVIGPTTSSPSGKATTLLGDAEFVDLNGDGILEIVNPPEFDSVPPGSAEPVAFSVFALSNGKYAPTGAVFNFFHTYVRGNAAPTPLPQTFTVADPSVPYVVTLANGDGRGGKRVSSATVSLNGVVVAEPQVFSQQKSAVTIPVTVGATNTVTVELAGAPGAKVSVAIGPK